MLSSVLIATAESVDCGVTKVEAYILPGPPWWLLLLALIGLLTLIALVERLIVWSYRKMRRE